MLDTDILKALPRPLNAALKYSLAWLGSRRWFRPLGMAFVRRLNRGTFHTLEATPGVERVYIRGSFARGDFTPLKSDIDLVLILTDLGGRSLAALTEIHRSLQRARRWNPNIRDRWQHMIVHSELPVVETFGALYGAHEWLDEFGSAAIAPPRWKDERLLAAAAWWQLCLWSGSAFHSFLHADDRLHDFAAGVKKTTTFASRLGLTMPCSDPADRRGALIAIYRAIEQGAARILAKPGPSAELGMQERVIRTDWALFLVLEDGLSDAALAARFVDHARRLLPATTVTYVLPSAALAVWPFPADPVREGVGPPPMPAAVAQEVYLFDALFLPSALRLAVAFPDAEDRLGRIGDALRRALSRYGGKPTGEGAAVRDVAALFAEGSSLCEALQTSLLEFARARGATG